jgi:hypothetical protein
MMTIAEHRLRIAVLGRKVEMQVAGSCAAGPGTSFRTPSARPSAAGSPPACGTTFSASGSAGRLALESLPLYLWGPGAKPLVELFGGIGAMSDNSKRTGPAVEAHYQFLTWLLPTVEKFPSSHNSRSATASRMARSTCSNG